MWSAVYSWAKTRPTPCWLSDPYELSIPITFNTPCILSAKIEPSFTPVPLRPYPVKIPSGVNPDHRPQNHCHPFTSQAQPSPHRDTKKGLPMPNKLNTRHTAESASNEEFVLSPQLCYLVPKRRMRSTTTHKVLDRHSATNSKIENRFLTPSTRRDLHTDHCHCSQLQ